MKPRCSARGMLGCVLLALGAVLLMLSLPLPQRKAADVFSAIGREAMVEAIALQTGIIPVNTADAAALDPLPGVGEATALAIIEERARHGPFFYPEDLMQVSGIGEKKLSDMRAVLDLTEE